LKAAEHNAYLCKYWVALNPGLGISNIAHEQAQPNQAYNMLFVNVVFGGFYSFFFIYYIFLTFCDISCKFESLLFYDFLNTPCEYFQRYDSLDQHPSY
jgi:hypothetical protein